MKNRKITFILLPLLAVVLEALPYGAVCNFATPEGESIRKTFSYFDLTPYGYANFGPFLTALATVLLFVLGIVFFVRERVGLFRAIRFTALLATVLSLLPLMYGIRYYSVTAGAITITLFVLSLFSLKIKT